MPSNGKEDIVESSISSMATVENSSYLYSFAHQIEGSGIHIPFGKSDATWEPAMVDVAARLIRAYKYSLNSTNNRLKQISDNDLWTHIVRDNFGQMIAFVQNDDAEQLSRFLVDFGSQYLWFGGISTGVDGYNHWDTSEQAVARTYFDKLISLGEYLGALPTENPEQGVSGNWQRHVKTSPEEIATKVSRSLGVDIAPPLGFIHTVGIRIGERLLHYRHINAAYLAAKIATLSDKTGRICEFGGGLGIAAYYMHKMGFLDYTLFDIPLTNLFSSWFLIGALGSENVSLEGEKLKPNAVKIRANWQCLEMPRNYFSVVANMDSFPEINRTIFLGYVEQIQKMTTDYVLSINHEVDAVIPEGERHLNVSEILDSQSGLTRVYRAPYWIRRGYVEELYRVNKTFLGRLL